MNIKTGDELEKYDLHAFHKGIEGGPRWEVSHNIVCEKCDTENTSIDVSGELIVFVCHQCDNWYKGSLSDIIWIDNDTGEIRTSDWNIPFELTGRANKW
jgi:hypothetical protein